MKIGIVGGSIAGCSAALLLLKEGHEVTVFERSRTTLVGRGGGIGTIPSVINQIIKEGILDEHFSYFPISQMPFVGKSEQHEPFGRTAWSMPMNLYVFQWNELWKSLRGKIPDEYYHTGKKVTNALPLDSGKVELHINEEQKEVFDLVLFADGYQSLGRRLLFPEAKLKYRGYILWRGLLPESEMQMLGPLKDAVLRLSYVNTPGHNVIYYIPNPTGSIKEGERIFNWAAYIPMAAEELDDLMTDNRGRIRQGTLPPGTLRASKEAELKKFLTKNTPAYYADIVHKTKNSYIQVIYTLDLEAYYKNRMCLIGDAGMVIQPFTGSGVFKGYNNAMDLISSLQENTSLEDALEKWSENQVINAKRLLALGEQMEKAFIWEQLDFSKVDERTTYTWWRDSVTFPDNFNYQK